MPFNELSLLDQHEGVIAEASRLYGPPRGRHFPLKSVCCATPGTAVWVEAKVFARDMDRGLGPEFSVIGKGGLEIDALGMAKEPRGIVIFFTFDGCNSERHVQRATLATERATGGWSHDRPEVSDMSAMLAAGAK